jgi:hypothetical protein
MGDQPKVQSARRREGAVNPAVKPSAANKAVTPNYFILIAMGAEDVDGRHVESLDIALHRLDVNKWPIYKGTPNRSRFQRGDHCVVYIGGTGRNAQHFIASAVIDSVMSWESKLGLIDGGDIMTDIPDMALTLCDVHLFAKPVSIRPLLSTLEVIPSSTPRWGIVFQGGCRAISERDFRMIAGTANEIVDAPHNTK